MIAQRDFDFIAGPPPAKSVTRTQKAVMPHVEARKIGFADGVAGERRSEHRWPSGVYGHADYWLGYADGERSRA